MNKGTKQKLRIGCAGTICAAIVCLLAVVMLPWPKPSLYDLLDKHILNPIPQGMRNIQNVSYFNPSLGDGHFVARFECTEHAREELLRKWPWSTNDYAGMFLRDHSNFCDSRSLFYEYDATNRILHLELHFPSGTNGVIAGQF